MKQAINKRKEDRRKKIKTVYLGLGSCMNRRFNIRREEDRIDPKKVEQDKFKWLGPGWL